MGLRIVVLQGTCMQLAGDWKSSRLPVCSVAHFRPPFGKRKQLLFSSNSISDEKDTNHVCHFGNRNLFFRSPHLISDSPRLNRTRELANSLAWYLRLSLDRHLLLTVGISATGVGGFLCPGGETCFSPPRNGYEKFVNKHNLGGL